MADIGTMQQLGNGTRARCLPSARKPAASTCCCTTMVRTSGCALSRSLGCSGTRRKNARPPALLLALAQVSWQSGCTLCLGSNQGPIWTCHSMLRCCQLQIVEPAGDPGVWLGPCGLLELALHGCHSAGVTRESKVGMVQATPSLRAKLLWAGAWLCFWTGDQAFYYGEVTSYDAASGRHSVVYTDGALAGQAGHWYLGTPSIATAAASTTVALLAQGVPLLAISHAPHCTLLPGWLWWAVAGLWLAFAGVLKPMLLPLVHSYYVATGTSNPGQVRCSTAGSHACTHTHTHTHTHARAICRGAGAPAAQRRKGQVGAAARAACHLRGGQRFRRRAQQPACTQGAWRSPALG